MLYRKIDDAGLFIEDVILDTAPILMETVTETVTDPITGEQTQITVQKPVMRQITETITDSVTGEEITITREDTVPDSHYVETPCPGGFYHPKWDGAQWIEGGQAPEPAPTEPSETERIKALEDAMLVMMGGAVNV